jgi:DNA replication and repair protein RecF
MRCVLFDPDDIRLISGSPARRRDFLDTIFSTNEWLYAQALSQYNKALKHRNELLDQIRLGKAAKSELFYWDQSLFKNSEVIYKYRQKFISSVNEFWSKHENEEIRNLSIRYFPSIVPALRSEEEIKTEIALGYTKRGSHRDDFMIESQLFNSEDKNIAFWGSRGQQRLAVLALRLGQINYFSLSYKEKPILLLDDIFSELDDSHRKIVVEICDKYQVIFTTAEEEVIKYLPTAQIQKI